LTRVLRAIVVEDEPPIQNIIIKVLGRCDYIVRAARGFQPEDFEEEPE